MADQEHLDILKQGVEAWNQWRDEHLDIQPDLSGINLRLAKLTRINLRGANLFKVDLAGAYLESANLSEAILSKAELAGAELAGANLRNADLLEANLSELDFARADGTDPLGVSLFPAYLYRADLVGANFSRANLRGAYLVEADLSNTNCNTTILYKADLKGAKLSGADLTESDLSGASLDSANLSTTILGWTRFGDIDLSKAKGLDTAQHRGPSSIGIDTIIRSRGNIPDVFLRGAGVPDSWITYAHSLIGRPIDFYSCFISYSSQDEAFAKQLYADLQSNGVRCWFAPEDLKIGDHYHQRIDESIRLYDKLILILSEHAVQSAWVEREVVAAREKEDREQRPVLFPLRLDDAVMSTTKAWAADVRRRWHIGDFTQWKHHDTYQQAFERLLRDLEAEQKPKD